MINLNLRPWRDELRREKRNQYIGILVLCALVGFGAAYLWQMNIASRMSMQTDRNNFLRSETKLLDQKIIEIRTLREERQALIDRMEVIQNLQKGRPTAVHLFDQLARLVPEDVYLTSATKSGNKLSLNGIGKTNISVTDLMRALDESDYFTNPSISAFASVDFDPLTGSSGYRFSINVDQTRPSDGEEE